MTYVGPEPDDQETLGKLPDDLRRFLERTNGLVAFHGGRLQAELARQFE